ncbi:hypothetical protein F4604DRAFT_1939089 [Suillus subluteus]|nr:hypothetical protein F4604DRAFT_1939089 [Suillus subluteus]
MLQEHEKLSLQPHEQDCNLETVITAIMLWSNSTYLASFGNASLWLIYLFIGNQSKYIHGKPTSFAAHHLAYIPKLLDTIQDFYKDTFGQSATAAVLTHCKCELMQAIWRFLLDADFIDAYQHGFVIKFPDGVSHRVFPHIFTYAADYPEKVLLACMKFLGRCPCPRCLVQKDNIFKLGTNLINLVHELISVKGYSILSSVIERIIGATSVTPIQNAFLDKLAKFRFDFHSMLVPDFMHKFELGVWKATLTHLLQILYAYGGNAVQDLNEQYRLVPTFGRDTVCKFSANVSGLTKLAAHDFEDLLQCAMPVFDGLLPEPFNSTVLNLLFELATWHAFRKLSACAQCQHIKASKDKNKRSERTNSEVEDDSPPKHQVFNLLTYKLHALGDYVKLIWQYGTTDNYSMQVGELEHCRVKHFYVWTNKNKFARGIARLQCHEHILQRMREVNHERAAARDTQPPVETEDLCPSLHFIDQDPLPHCSPEDHYQMSSSQKHYWDVSSWLGKNRNNQATKNFLLHLKDHLLGRLSGLAYDGDETLFTATEQNSVIIMNNWIYHHKVLRVNYTTYNLQCAQDSLNPHTHADIMVLARDQEDSHPYWVYNLSQPFDINVQLLCWDHPLPVKQPTMMRIGTGTVSTCSLTDIFMRFRRGGVRHKTTQRETSCLLDDQDALDKVPFQREKEHHLSELDEAFEEDDDMEDNKNGDMQSSSEEADDSEGESDDTDDEDDEDDDLASTPFKAIINDTIADKMDEFGYSSLDQVLDEDDVGEDTNNDLDADELGPEDGEDVMNVFDEDNFADL